MQENRKFSEKSRINLVIENILDEPCPFLEEQAREISELTAIGKALGTGKDIRALLKMILSIVRRFSKADSGTLYLVDQKKKKLDFHAFHNDSLNIADVYKTNQFQFDGTRKIISFSKDALEKAAALANQASVILTQQKLIIEMKELFEDFIKAIAVSIDEKSKHTGDHIQRVTELCIMIARKINEDNIIFNNIHLSDDQMDELRIAALMHDTGKITTPDHIISKSSRLETFFERIELIKIRWELFKTNLKLMAAQRKLSLLNQTKKQEETARIDSVCTQKIETLETEMIALSTINSSKEPLNQDLIDQLEDINEKSCEMSRKPYLTEDEFENLCVIKGTLTAGERKIINNHARLTEKILNKLPWPKKLSNIPSIAGAHHEKLDGSGYPLHLNIDKDIVKLFFESGVHIEYAKRHLSPDRIDL